MMKLDYDNKRTRSTAVIEGAGDVENRSPFELFSDFYEQQNNQPMSPDQEAYMRGLIEKTWEDAQ
jgi:exonuclease SbcD